MNKSISLTINMPFKNEKEMHNAFLALQPELNFKGRAKISLKEDKETSSLTIRIEAEDLASLHAAVGSQLRALKVITGVQNFSED
jgi:tRNA threonylcarbamoyladenosine modification (KEOPS) complex  Pcc1 subunit